MDALVLHTFYSDEAVTNAVAAARRGAEQAGRDPDGVRVWSVLATVGDHIPEDLRLKKTVGRLASYLRGYGDVLVKANGWDPAVLERFRADPFVRGFAGRVRRAGHAGRTAVPGDADPRGVAGRDGEPARPSSAPRLSCTSSTSASTASSCTVPRPPSSPRSSPRTAPSGRPAWPAPPSNPGRSRPVSTRRRHRGPDRRVAVAGPRLRGRSGRRRSHRHGPDRRELPAHARVGRRAPHRWWPRSPPGTEAARRRVANGSRREVGLYADLAPTLDVRIPHCWHAVITDDALRFTLLLEDLAPRTPGVQVDGCSPGAGPGRRAKPGRPARVPVAETSRCTTLPYLDPPAERASFMGGLTVRCADVFLDRYGDRARRRRRRHAPPLRRRRRALVPGRSGDVRPAARRLPARQPDVRLRRRRRRGDRLADARRRAAGPGSRLLRRHQPGDRGPAHRRGRPGPGLPRGTAEHGASTAYTLDDCRRGYRLRRAPGPDDRDDRCRPVHGRAQRRRRTPCSCRWPAAPGAAVRDLGTLDLL